MKNIKTITLAVSFLLMPFLLLAQVPAPGTTQTEPIVIMGGTAHLGTGEVIENAVIAFEAGKISVVGTIAMKRGFDGYKIIDGSGKHIYPGFITANSDIGLVEINAVRATRDVREVGGMNPNVRALIAYNTDSEIIPTVKTMGVLIAQVTPQGGRISGSSSVVSLDAWNWEDAAIKTDDGIHLNWPRAMSFDWHTRSVAANKKYDSQIDDIQNYFTQAAAYCKIANPVEKNLHFEAMRPLFDRKSNLYIHANEAKTMSQGIAFAENFNLKPVIVGGNESWMITDYLKAHNVPVILNKTHRLPSRTDADITQPFKVPAILQEAGVTFCLSVSGRWSSWQARNLPFQAGQAVAFGLDYEAAVQAISLNVAKILGVDDQLGSIEIGKDATLFISEGDVLDMRTSKVTNAFIQGRGVNLHNRQKQLYDKFKAKYNQR